MVDKLRLRVLEALGDALEPLLLLLLKTGITWKDFSGVAKARFVKVATESFGIRGRPTNASRVAILTGIDRRDVRKLRRAIATQATYTAGFMSKPTLVLDGWFHDPEFLTPAGEPRELHPCDGEACFATLVRRYAPGIPPVAMIKELQAAGAVEQTSDGRLRALKRTYIPRELSDNQIRLWGSVLQDVGATLEHNVTRDQGQRARFERRALSLRVDRRALHEFEEFLAKEGQAFLERVDDWLMAHQAETSGADARAVRMGVGIYEILDAAPRSNIREPTK